MSTRLQLLVRIAVVPIGVMASLASVWSSVDAPEAVPLYGACVTTAECVREAEVCLHGVVGTAATAHGICTYACTDDAGCSDGARCVEVAPGERACAARCSQAGDCGDPDLTCPAGGCVPVQ